MKELFLYILRTQFKIEYRQIYTSRTFIWTESEDCELLETERSSKYINREQILIPKMSTSIEQEIKSEKGVATCKIKLIESKINKDEQR